MILNRGVHAPRLEAVMQGPRSTLARGAIAGAIGAAVLALFFLVVDLIRGAPLGTAETPAPA